MTNMLPEVAEGLSLPLDFVTRKTSIVAKSGAGKSYGLRKITETIVQADRGIPGALVDPLGVMYGLRFAPDGSAAGLSIPIIGGAHGDVPIRASSGPAVARALVNGNSVAIVDISQIDDEEQWEFLSGFCSALTRELMARKRAFWLAIDEADLFAPETPLKGQLECQRSVRHYCRRARNFGGGYTLATQSTSVIDKKVVGQSDLIIAMRVTSPTDQAPILDWLKAGIGKERAVEIVRTLASFKTGEAWFYSPEWLGIVERHRILPCQTFDSSKTPKVGEVFETTGKGAAVDLDGLRAHFESSLEEETDDDVDALRAQIAELRRQLDAASDAQPKVVEKVIIQPGDLEALSEVVRRVEAIRDRVFADSAKVVGDLLVASKEISKRLDLIGQQQTQHVRSPQAIVSPPTDPAKQPSGGDKAFRAGAIRMLEACAQFSDRGLTRAQLAALSKIKQGPTFSTYISELRRAEYITEDGDRIRATHAGIAFLPNVPPQPKTAEDIISRWRPEFRAGVQRMLDIITAAYPNAVKRDVIAERSQIAKGPTFSTYLSELKRAELVAETSSGLRAVVLDLVAESHK